MNKELAALLTLLRAGLWEKEPDDLSVFPLSGEDWSRVYHQAQRQTVTGIVYRGLCLLPDRFLPSDPLLLRWVAATDTIERRNRKMNSALTGLYGMFRKNNLHPVLLKGQGVASLYEHPLLRECGDIDFYFPTGEEERCAISLIQKTGCRVQYEADGSFHYRWNGMMVEHHSHLFDINNPFLKNYLEKIECRYGYHTAFFSPEIGMEIAVPSPMLHLLLQNTHIMKHAFGWGIGLRQLCDMARACYCFHDSINPYETRSLYHKTGIENWSRLLHSFFQDYLGLSPECLPYKEKRICSQPLLEIIMRGGNFGQYASGRGDTSQSTWKRKLHTSRSFLHNARFSYRYAPKEAFWTFMNLLIGQIHVKRTVFPGGRHYV